MKVLLVESMKGYRHGENRYLLIADAGVDTATSENQKGFSCVDDVNTI
jgi:non-homologous end joining protein Ku